MRYITRPRTNGVDAGFWWVRFYSGKTTCETKPITQRTFSDSRYGGDPDRSLRAAKIWRTKTAKVLGKHETPYKARDRYRATTGSNTGVAGISHTDRINNKGCRKTCFQVSWSETLPTGERKGRTKTFSYPPDDLERKNYQFRAAKRWREKMQKEHYIGSQHWLKQSKVKKTR